MSRFVIPGRLPTMNEIITASKSHHMRYSNMKNTYTNAVAMHARAQQIPVLESVYISITWYCKNRKQDPDNISSGTKFILDGLVKAGKLENDGWKQIRGVAHRFEIDKRNERVEVELREMVG